MQMVNILSIFGSLLLMVLVLDFIRRNLLKEKYSVLWFALSLVVIVLSLWEGLLDKLATFVGIAYAPSLLFFTAFLFVLFILLHFSVVISILYEKNKVLTQELAIINDSLREASLVGRSQPRGDNRA